jgi:hypothetical protein
MRYVEFVGCYSDDKVNSLDKANSNHMVWLKLINFDDNAYWDIDGNFIKFDYRELDTILASNGVSKVDKLISTYLNIKKWISVTDSETSRFVAFPSQNKLATDIGCTSKSIQEYTDKLIDMKLLYKKNYGSFKRLLKGEEVTQNSNTVYALDEKYLDGKYDKQLLIDYMKFNYQMIGDEFGSFNQPLNEYQKNKVNDKSINEKGCFSSIESDEPNVESDDCEKDVPDSVRFTYSPDDEFEEYLLS